MQCNIRARGAGTVCCRTLSTIVLEADDVRRPEPSVFASPRLGHVFEAVFLRDDQIPKEGFVFLAHLSSSLLPYIL
jgi:hypothetical protein